ncbi:MULTISPECIES: hypothetical protein [Pseudomonas]|jgi:hypothetical protein|uniref:DUF1640 domain-containing protein n=1 Tax=Pseudomonas paracarnis TaxID=2750625 RepID=A0ABU6BXU0_9PSED|nr:MULTISPECIES: hypothetical protein [Pseudomonas]KWV68886.1 hypothetical protein PFLuk1_03566 [Pseudomonas fluorescens]MBW9242374.1 hypothetical protein [Pseudomonas paracarnis]MCK3840058.1 hypothetical protein [Pseudomonas sp. NCIMB 10586]MEB3785124.1 hypothetical protein [Pseudomonas paracarnis]NHC50645.1 hypothetical protein [Pseudomonas sp. AU8050]
MKLEIALYQALMAINVPEQKINAVIEAMESDLNTYLATKVDIANLHNQLQSEISQLEVKLTIRMGVMLSAAVGVMMAFMKLMQ